MAEEVPGPSSSVPPVPPTAGPPTVPDVQSHSTTARSDSQERPTPMLEVHPVHGAVHGWRDFFVHIVIVAIGLCLALGLEETVEAIHHHYQVAKTRRALLQEREANKSKLIEETRSWRSRVAELQNNLLVFQYLQEHPGTPQERLPGVLVWRTSGYGIATAVWDAAHQSGVIALMPIEEIEDNSTLYEVLHEEAKTGLDASLAALDAERYELIDPNPSHLTPERLAREIDLLQVALGKQWLHGILMVDLVENFPDFPPTVTRAELDKMRHTSDEQTAKALDEARALTTQRLKAATGADLQQGSSQPSR